MPMYVVKAKIKDAIPNFSVASDFPEALNAKVEAVIKEAARRAEENGRKTVMPKDL
ncbi:MAG: histone-like protein [Nanoarchaeota archaeon]